jgi:hypothetical protein
MKHILLRFNKDSLAVLTDNQVQKELSARAMQMSKADAILLFYAGNYSEVQWDGMAAPINKLMDDSTRRQFGCIIPCARTLNRHLERMVPSSRMRTSLLWTCWRTLGKVFRSVN